jgi:hypothetical protein
LCPRGEENTEKATGTCKDETLGNELADNARSRGTQRDADADLLLAGRGSRQQKVGDIHKRNQ